jgi:protocatechuate 3,4-dioxygenase beta subunit
MTRRYLAIAIGIAIAAAVLWSMFRSTPRETATASTPPVVPAGAKATLDHAAWEPHDRVDGLDRTQVRGTLRLEGQVIDDAEAPVAGAIVTLRGPSRRTATTGEDGGFEITELLGGEYAVAARVDSSAAGPVRVLVTPTVEPLILRMRQASSLHVRVEDAASRQPVSEASVELRGSIDASARTAADGVARFDGIPPGSYDVIASSAGVARGHSRVRIAAGAKRMDVTIALARGVPVSGTVVSSRGEPIADATVYGRNLAAGPGERIRLEVAERVVTGADGRFAFAALATGTYQFQADHPAYAPGRSRLTTVLGANAISGVEIVMAEAGTVRGHVIDAAGAPVAAATVVASEGGSGQERMAEYRSAVDQDGAFVLAGLPRTRLRVSARSNQAASAPIEVDLGAAAERSDLVLRLSIDGAIGGIVVDIAGEPIPEAQVIAFADPSQAHDRAGYQLRVRADVTDAAGTFRIAGLPDGEYHVRATRNGTASPRDYLTRSGAIARTGDTAVRLVLETPGSIRGVLALDNGEHPKTFTISAGLGTPVPFAGDDGVFELGDLAPGRVSLTVRGPGFDPTVISDLHVEASKVTDAGRITIKRGRTIAGRVLDTSGRPVADARVFAGYRLIGDGTSLTQQSWGPGASGATKETTSDADGRFRLRGIGFGATTLIADHTGRGRSRPVLVAASSESSEVDIVLESVGELRGRVTRGGAPVGGMYVSASPRGMSDSNNLVVATDEDGHFAFVRMSPGEYSVSAVTGMTPLAGITMTGRFVTVPATTPELHLALPSPAVTLTVTLANESGQPVRLAQLWLVEGKHDATTGDAVAQLAANASGTSAMAIITGKSVDLRDLRAGDFTGCVTPFPRALAEQDAAKAMDHFETNAASMRAFCQPVRLTAEPRQRVTFNVIEPTTPSKP